MGKVKKITLEENTSKENNPLAFRFNKETLNELEKVKKILKENNTKAISFSIRLLNSLLQEIKKGKKVVIEDPNNKTKKELIIKDGEV